MHDPMTVVCDVKLPLPKWLWRRYREQYRKRGPFIADPRPTLFTIWHKDTERDGSDDCCDFSGTRPKLSELDERVCQEIVDWEVGHPYYFACHARVVDPRYRIHEIGPGDAMAVVLALWKRFAWNIERRNLSWREIRRAMEAGTGEGDNLQSSFAMEPDDTNPRARMLGVVRNACRLWRGASKRWWQKGKWHVHHWRIQVQSLQLLRRWLFDRCAKCGGRFGLNESVMGEWSGKRIWHFGCDRTNPTVSPTPSATKSTSN